MPAFLLPDLVTALMGEVIAGGRAWVRNFGNFDDADHPAQAALRALDAWRGDEPNAH